MDLNNFKQIMTHLDIPVGGINFLIWGGLLKKGFKSSRILGKKVHHSKG